MNQTILISMLVPATLLVTSIARAQDSPVPDCTLGGSAVSGMVVHLDPHTGRPTSQPLPEQARAFAALQAARANRSSVGLVEERGPTGGVRVNLRNRFRSPVAAVIGPDGQVFIDHVSCTPAPAKNGGGS